MPGSPFQFRALPQHLAPLLKDVKVANMSFNPKARYRNTGFVAYVKAILPLFLIMPLRYGGRSVRERVVCLQSFES